MFFGTRPDLIRSHQGKKRLMGFPLTENRYSLLSLFTGAGGLDYGFESTGHFFTRVAIEYQPEFCETLRANQTRGFLPEAKLIAEDISSVKALDAFRSIFPDWRPDGIIGGPPCQSFSQMGKRKGLQDPRGLLVFNFLEWVSVLRPKFFLMENVPDLATIQGGEVFEKLRVGFFKSGYNLSYRVLMAADYGAATFRKRLFVVGMKGKCFSFPEPTHIPTISHSNCMELDPHVTAGDALYGLPKPTLRPPGIPNGHYRIKHTASVTERFACLPEGGYDPVRKRTKLAINKPSPSLVAGNLNGIRSHIHPTEPRELTNRESARIHGFPDDFEFAGNHAAMGLQIANSVPIALGKAIATEIAEQLDL